VERSASPYVLARWLFCRGLAFAYLAAFASIWSQILGLYGERGILPAAAYLEGAARRLGPERFWHIPTLLWLDASDASLVFIAGAGFFLAALFLVGFLDRILALHLFVLYFSIFSIGRSFLWCQWDILPAMINSQADIS
jgi:hypothetical protein